MVRNLSAPIDVSIELTHKCNLNCIHCFQPEFRKGKLLTRIEIFRLADELSRLKVFAIFLNGGEPLLREDWAVIGKHLINLGFAVGLSTNGTLITKKVAKELLDTNLYKGLQVSLDGSCSSVHDKIRGSGSFEQTIQGLHYLSKLGIHPNIAVTVMNHNIKDIPNIIDLALKKRVRHIHVISLMPAGRAKINYKELDPPLEEWIRMEHLLVKAAKRVKGKLSLDCGNRRYLPQNLDFSEEDYSKVDKKFAGCPAGKTKAEIDCFGNVYGCDILKDNNLLAGNVREKSFGEIWTYSNIFKKWRNKTPQSIVGKCKKCKWLFACVGGCPAMSLSEECDIYSSDPSCPGPY